ncbi:MAG: hypothetical protein ACRBCK_06480 [Alphaproteobacteria bacterium]
MIRNKDVAKSVNKILLDCSSEINASILYVKENGSEEDFLVYRRAMSKILGELLLEGLNPLYADNPELKPDGFD